MAGGTCGTPHTGLGLCARNAGMASSSELDAAVAGDRRLYAARFPTTGPATVGELLEAIVEAVDKALDDGDLAAVAYFTNWHPDYRGAGAASIIESRPDGVDVRLAIARGHGFADWSAAQESGARRFDELFEAAVDAVVAGDGESRASHIAARPSIVSDRSPLGHAATLLHYVAANGVEFRRQESGPAAPAIAQVLLSAGAEV